METVDRSNRVEYPNGTDGVDVSKSSDDRFIALMLAFAGLTAAQQASFMDTLNVYLFASPQRRRQYVRAWARRLSADESGIVLCQCQCQCGCGCGSPLKQNAS